MIKLTINNSLCRIEGLSITQFKELREILSYSDSAGSYFSGRHGGGKRYLLDKKGQFPTGLLYLVDQHVGQGPYLRIDLRQRPEPRQGLFRLSLPYPPYPEQIAAAEACKRYGRGVVVAPTGLGKSVIIALIIDRLQVPTLVVVPSLELKRQLTASLKAAFGSMDNIRVENVDALDPKAPLKDYDCVILDEFHRSGAATYRKLNKAAWAGVYFKVGLTATPFRSKDEERLLLESVLSQVIYRVEYRDAVLLKRIVPMEAYYYDIPPTTMKGNPSSWPAVYSELVVHNDYRNALIADLMKAIDAPTLTLVKEIVHGEILSELTGAPFANGQDGNTRERILEFNLGETRSLIGTTGVLGEGVDSRPAEWIILAAGGKSKNSFIQQIGRGFRVYPGKEVCKIIMFRDKSNPWLLKHHNACIRYLKEEFGVKAVKLDLP